MNGAHHFNYTPEENLNRVLMDRHTKYIVVEGDDDVPKYESTIKHLGQGLMDFEPVFLGGKEKIKSLLERTTNNNFIAIVDKDFNEHVMPNDSRLIILSRYSIENFIFCLDVLAPLIANLTKESEALARSWFNITEWMDHLHEKLTYLLRALYFYQNNVLTDRKPWSKIDFYENNSWKVCSNKVSDILNDLYQNNVPIEQIEAQAKYENISKEELIKYFPGKLLIQSLYKYIKEKFVAKYGSAKKLTSHINSHNSLTFSCTALLQRQANLCVDLRNAILFLNPPLHA